MIIVADNLTTGVPDPDTRRRYRRTFLPMLAAAGLGMILQTIHNRLKETTSWVRNKLYARK